MRSGTYDRVMVGAGAGAKHSILLIVAVVDVFSIMPIIDRERRISLGENARPKSTRRFGRALYSHARYVLSEPLIVCFCLVYVNIYDGCVIGDECLLLRAVASAELVLPLPPTPTLQYDAAVAVRATREIRDALDGLPLVDHYLAKRHPAGLSRALTLVSLALACVCTATVLATFSNEGTWPRDDVMD